MRFDSQEGFAIHLCGDGKESRRVFCFCLGLYLRGFGLEGRAFETTIANSSNNLH